MDRNRPSHLSITSSVNLPKRAVQPLKEQAYLLEELELWQVSPQQATVGEMCEPYFEVLTSEVGYYSLVSIVI